MLQDFFLYEVSNSRDEEEMRLIAYQLRMAFSTISGTRARAEALECLNELVLETDPNEIRNLAYHLQISVNAIDPNSPRMRSSAERDLRDLLSIKGIGG